jgi:hypothetical protein
MRVVVSLTLLLFWLFLAYRRYEHGDMPLAGLFVLIGVVLTIYRLRTPQARI